MKRNGMFSMLCAFAMAALFWAFAVENPLSRAEAMEGSCFVGEDGSVYEYMQYSEPAAYEYDGTAHTLLATVERKKKQDGILMGSYGEWTEYAIIDYGVTEEWSVMSNPFFIGSCARGGKYTEDFRTFISVDAKEGVGIPPGSQRAVSRALEGGFSLNQKDGCYTKAVSCELYGPDSGSPFNSRTFLYKKGYHSHVISVVERTYSQWEGLVSETEHRGCYGYEPAVLIYFEDSYVS